jgi:acetyltransferase
MTYHHLGTREEDRFNFEAGARERIIGRYPVHLIDVVRTADGRAITIRPTLPQDQELQKEFFRSLSAESRHSRFMTWLKELPDAQAEQFASIDYRSHLALLAEVFDRGRETMIGEARYVVDANDRQLCEFAISVADGWRRCGLGSTLLSRLEHEAAASGISLMSAQTLVSNNAMLGLAVRAGYRVVEDRCDVSQANLEKKLATPSAPLLIQTVTA